MRQPGTGRRAGPPSSQLPRAVLRRGSGAAAARNKAGTAKRQCCRSSGAAAARNKADHRARFRGLTACNDTNKYTTDRNFVRMYIMNASVSCSDLGRHAGGAAVDDVDHHRNPAGSTDGKPAPHKRRSGLDTRGLC